MSSLDKPREKALLILCRIEEGVFADSLLDQARREFDSRDSAFILELVYGVLRNRAKLDWMLDRLSTQPLSETDVRTRNILRLGAYQMLFLDKVPVSAAVNTSVELAKTHGRKSGYVNGMLRNVDRKRAELAKAPLPEDPAVRLSILYSHPLWLVKRWLDRIGPDRTEAVLKENNLPAPLIIRTNTLRTTRDELKASLTAEGAVVEKTRYSAAGLVIHSSSGLLSLPSFQKGSFIVQDEAAQLVGLLVAPRPGETVLDACAAPGGKATHLAELMQNQGRLVAVESDAGRIGRIEENRKRLGASVIETVRADAAAFREGTYDAILIDAPCSGLGVLRRHPDGRWHKKVDTLRERANVQRSILANCSSLLKPGGALVYATCTTEPEENENVISEFLSGSGGRFVPDDPRPFLPEPARHLVDSKSFFRTFPLEPGMDGFFAVRIKRTA